MRYASPVPLPMRAANLCPNKSVARPGACYTEDAVEVTDEGPIYGREAIEKHFADVFKQVHVSNHLGKDDQYSPHIIGTGNEIWENGEWSLTFQGKSGGPIQAKGYWSAIDTREGDTWKIRMLTWNVPPPPPASNQ